VKPLPKVVERWSQRRAKQRAWLRVRKAVLARDGYACRACGSQEQVDVHHKKLRSAGGQDVSRNLLALCRCCHALVHAYRLFIHGDSADGKLQFEWVQETAWQGE
jgi:5-methylcytosine-specific restriction endonuclease McrA